MAMRWTWMGIGMVLAGCGPQVGIDDGSGSTGDPPPTTTSPQPSTSGTPGTSGSPPNPTTDDTATEGPSDGTVADETSLDFVGPPFDVGEPIECSVWQDDECPRGEKCMPWANDGGNAWNATRCSPIAPDAGEVGDACTVEGNGVSGIDDCAEHSMCFFVESETNTGVCVAFCRGDESDPFCDDAGSQCNLGGDSVLALCIPMCDPLASDCNAGEVCVPAGDGFQCAPDESGEQGQAGDPCEFVNVCDPGLFCADAAAVPGCENPSGCCTPYCDLGDPSVCEVLGPDVECEPWYAPGQAPPGYEELGSCTPPS